MTLPHSTICGFACTSVNTPGSTAGRVDDPPLQVQTRIEGDTMELIHTAAREGRLSSFLLGELHMSASLMNKLKWGDAIRVNGQPQRTNYPVKPGDIITVRLEEEPPLYPAEDGPLAILYEDDHILVVDKPAGMLIHPSRSKNDGTLANYVYGYYRRTNQHSAFHPVTRLDRDTFGIVLLAKNSHVHTLLQAMDAGIHGIQRVQRLRCAADHRRHKGQISLHQSLPRGWVAPILAGGQRPLLLTSERGDILYLAEKILCADKQHTPSFFNLKTICRSLYYIYHILREK